MVDIVTDDLRTRIVAALFDELNSDRQDWKGHLDMDALADAVIRELGLRQEVEQRGSLMRYRKAGVPLLTVRRYVTEWTADE